MSIQTHRIVFYLVIVEERLIASLFIEDSSIAINIMIAKLPIGIPTSYTILI